MNPQSATQPRFILALESSCDETACALVERDGRVVVNAIASQVDLHAKFGGVVPEVASRRHIEAFLPMVESAMTEGGATWDDIDSIAVTHAPGLIGCLLIGVETAKALAWAKHKPLRAVHHLQAHLHAPFLYPAGKGRAHLLLEGGGEHRALPFDAPWSGAGDPPRVLVPAYPHVGLLISGGHTSLALVEGPCGFKTLASTRDDAVGEAYDKVARILGIGFPGGPVIDRLAAEGDASRFPFTVPMNRRNETDFSFSGLKSAVARKVGELGGERDEAATRDICAAFQSAAIEALLGKAFAAVRASGVSDLVIAGGVAANRGLRAAAGRACPRGVRVWFPDFSLCTDNAAMIGGLAWHIAPMDREAMLSLNPRAVLPLEASAPAA